MICDNPPRVAQPETDNAEASIKMEANRMRLPLQRNANRLRILTDMQRRELLQKMAAAASITAAGSAIFDSAVSAQAPPAAPSAGQNAERRASFSPALQFRR
jgi:hypothetical protein